MVMNVHDELIIEVPKGSVTVEEVVATMCQVPGWSEGLPLAADGYRCDYYMNM